MNVELGIIEGFYGTPWSPAQRADNITFLRPHGYTFYLYAPKADPYLRLRWRDQHPDDAIAALSDLAAHCAATGVRFGVGLSPMLNDGFDGDARDALARKLAFLDALGIADLALLFDDMRGETPDLAQRQLDVVHWAADRTAASRVLMCPSYYTDDPVLDRVFGKRPAGYLDDLGRGLDRAIEVFWTGEEVCARQFTEGHLQRVTETLRRRPFLWDNYPVNDGARMSQYLHVRAFTGRPAGIADHIAGHGVNPAVQPVLSRIPAITLAESYRTGSAYEYGQAFRAAALTVAGDELAAMLYDDVLVLQDVGLDRLGEREQTLRTRYSGLDHPVAREIIAWLDGRYRITDAAIKAMVGNEQG